MSRLEVYNYIISILKEELGLSVIDDITLETRLEDIGVDSIGMMTLIVYLEEKYAIELSELFFVDNPESIETLISVVLRAKK